MTSETGHQGPPLPTRAGYVSLVGLPNAGKSTLMNRLVGETVAIATHKPQTTRDRIRGIRTDEASQVIYVDTPGIHEARTLLNRYMVDLAVATLMETDLVYLVVDAAHMASKPEQVSEQTGRIVEAIETRHGRSSAESSIESPRSNSPTRPSTVSRKSTATRNATSTS